MTVQERMEKAVESCAREWAKIRTGMANPAILEGINIDYYGTPTPISHVSSIKAPEPRTLAIVPWEKNMLGIIEKAILAANIGLTPNNDGSMIRINFPILTKDRREELTKVARKIAEDGKVAIRNIRRDENEKLKKSAKDETWPEDDLKMEMDDVQESTDRFIALLDKMVADKESDLMKV
jgi:ribosome recycling factor